MTNQTAADLMTTDLVVLRPRHHLERAAREMRLSRIRHIPIVDDKGGLVGLLTQRDLLAAGPDLARPISSVMNADIKTVRPDTPAHEAALLILRYAIGCVPVVARSGELVGLITDTDFVGVAYQALGGTVSVDQIELEEHEADNV